MSSKARIAAVGGHGPIPNNGKSKSVAASVPLIKNCLIEMSLSFAYESAWTLKF